MDAVVEAAARIYALYGAPDRLTVEHPDCGHDFPALREQVYRLFETHLS